MENPKNPNWGGKRAGAGRKAGSKNRSYKDSFLKKAPSVIYLDRLTWSKVEAYMLRYHLKNMSRAVGHIFNNSSLP